jgi:hypothetical protein
LAHTTTSAGITKLPGEQRLHRSDFNGNAWLESSGSGGTVIGIADKKWALDTLLPGCSELDRPLDPTFAVTCLILVASTQRAGHR